MSKINSKISAKYNIGRYSNNGMEVQDKGKRVFIANSSNDEYVNWLLAVHFAKKYFNQKSIKNQSIMKTTNKKRKNPQTGSTHVFEDKMHQAKKPGKRKSAAGNVYYESRANRSDIGKLLAPKKATAKQLAAQNKFKINSAKARNLVSTGQAKTLKQAWGMIK